MRHTCLILSMVALVASAGAQISTWETRASMPLPRTAAAAAAVDGKIYVLGGFDESGEPTTTVQIYDTAGDSWNVGPEMATPRAMAGACALNGEVYLLGGSNGDWNGTRLGPLSSVMVYDPATGSWTAAADLQMARGGLAVGVVDGRIYAAGGASGFNVTDLIAATEVYDPGMNAWTRVADLPHTDRFMSGTGLKGKFYVWGTRGRNLFEYDPQQDDWEQYSCPFLVGQYSALVGAVDWVYLLSGWGWKIKSTKAVTIFDTLYGLWDEGPVVPAARFLMSAVEVDGTIYALGGSSEVIEDAPHPTDTVWAYQVYEPTAVRAETWGKVKKNQVSP